MSFWISKLLRIKLPSKAVKVSITSKPQDGKLKSIKNVEITLPKGTLSSGCYYDDLFIANPLSAIKVSYENDRVVEVEYQNSRTSIILDDRSPPIFGKVFEAKSIPRVGMTRSDSLVMLVQKGT